MEHATRYLEFLFRFIPSSQRTLVHRPASVLFFPCPCNLEIAGTLHSVSVPVCENRVRPIFKNS